MEEEAEDGEGEGEGDVEGGFWHAEALEAMGDYHQETSDSPDSLE